MKTHRRRLGWFGSVTLLVSACTSLTAEPQPVPALRAQATPPAVAQGQPPVRTGALASPRTVFRPDSFWYKPIPANAPLNANSSAYVAEFLRQKKAYYGTVSINTVEYASPVYVVDGSVPTVKVGHSCAALNKPTQPDASLDAQWSAVPIPAYAMPARGTDGEMTIYQPSTDRMWEFWLAKKDGNAWSACWGGMMPAASTNEGIWPNRYGTTATSLPFIGGQITPEELQQGEITHVMGIALVDLDHWDVVSWPATRSDGWNGTRLPNRIPEGMRFRLDPSINVDALQMSRVGKIIAKAAQKYGFVVWDHAGAITLRANNPMAYTARGLPDPYTPLFSEARAYSVLDGFPWDRLQFLPMNYGKP